MMRHERSIENPSAPDTWADRPAEGADRDLGAALASYAIRQALTDALWTRSSTGPLSRFDRVRAQERQDAIDFFAGVVDIESDEDAKFGTDEELLTLDLLCRIGGFDLELIRSGAIAKIRAKSAEHAQLLDAALAAARDQNTRKTN